MLESGKRISYGLFVAAIIMLQGCSSSGSNDGTGRVSLGISDGPIHDAVKVCVAFDEIEFKSGDQTTIIEFDPPETINLLDFQGMNAAPLLVNEPMDAGQYQWMRLGVDANRGSNGGLGDTGGVMCDGEASYIVMDGGAVYNLYVPSGAQSGLKLVGGFTVPSNGLANFTAEFDLMKSVKAPDGLSPDMILRPTIRLVNNIEAGTLTGQVANSLATAEGCEPSVYVFNDGVTPNEIDDGIEVVDPDDPVATAMVNEQVNSEGQTEYHYTVGYMLAGDYEAAFTCDGATFEPVDGKPAFISENTVTTVDFGFE